MAGYETYQRSFRYSVLNILIYFHLNTWHGCPAMTKIPINPDQERIHFVYTDPRKQLENIYLQIVCFFIIKTLLFFFQIRFIIYIVVNEIVVLYMCSYFNLYKSSSFWYYDIFQHFLKHFSFLCFCPFRLYSFACIYFKCHFILPIFFHKHFHLFIEAYHQCHVVPIFIFFFNVYTDEFHDIY